MSIRVRAIPGGDELGIRGPCVYCGRIDFRVIRRSPAVVCLSCDRAALPYPVEVRTAAAVPSVARLVVLEAEPREAVHA